MKDWDSLYKEKGIIQKKPSKNVIEAIDLFKKEGLEKILDLGCGTGRHTICLLKEGFKVYGCDSSEKAIEIASSTMKEIQFRKCDMTSLPYESGFFSGIICNFVIQHGRIEDVKKSISEIYRVLKRGGILYLSVISTKHPKFQTGEEIEPNTKINCDDIDGEIPHHFFTENEMKDWFKGFDIIKLEHFEGESEVNPGKRMAAWEIYAKK